MRKGFMLVEMITAVVLLMALSLAFVPVFRTLLQDVPKMYQWANINSSVQDLLSHIRADIDAAGELPDAYGGVTTGERTLLIEQPEGIVVYQLNKDDNVVRSILTAGQGQESKIHEENIWQTSQAKIKWQVWQKAGSGFAVEITTWIEHETPRGVEKKLANSRVFFVGALAGAYQAK